MDEKIKELILVFRINVALLIGLRKNQIRYILKGPTTDIEAYLPERVRQKGRTTAYHIRLLIIDKKTISSHQQTNDLFSKRGYSNMNKYCFRKFMETRKKLKRAGFKVSKVLCD